MIAKPVFETIQIFDLEVAVELRIHRPNSKNSLNTVLLKELTEAIQWANSLDSIKVIILSGSPSYFCTGMDFNEVSKGHNSILTENPESYYDLLVLISSCSKVVISKVEGRVNAGGIGIVSASDIVFASNTALFSLSEVLFGLLPACVLPFLIRRIGYQKSLWLALTTQNITAKRGHEIGLVDEIGSNMEELIRRNILRLEKLDSLSISNLKEYIQEIWIIDPTTKMIAVDKITELMNSTRVLSNINNFINEGKFPWDKK